MNGITKEQFNLWKHDPVSKLFFEFLRDKRKFLIDYASGAWVDGAEVPPAVRGQVIELGEIADLQFEAVEAFYKAQREESGSESEDSER